MRCAGASNGTMGCCQHFVIPADVSGQGYEWACCSCDNRGFIAFEGTTEAARWIEIAVAIVNDSRHSHVTWAEFAGRIQDDFYDDHERVGNGLHHRACLVGYDHVLAMLRRP